MRTVTLTRYETGPNGTYSRVVTDNGFQCYGMELPWSDNAPGKSCVPPGEFLFKVTDSPKHGRVYEEWDDPATAKREDVPGRTKIQIHCANWPRQLLGCVALGNATGVVLGINGIMGSRDAVARFMDDLENGPFTLTIAWEPHIDPEKA